jgi:hypothetical protein
MTLTAKRQTVFLLEWCQRKGLESGGPLSVFDFGEAGSFGRPVKAPSRAEVKKLLSRTPASRHSARQAAAIVDRALRKSRR